MNALLPGLWHRTLRRFGPYRLLALALLLVALLLGIWVHELDNQNDMLRAAIHAKQANRPLSAAVPVGRVPTGEQVDDFVAAFPRLDESAADLEQVFKSARKHNLQLPQGEYKFKQDAAEPLASYTAIFPVKADYAALRAFSADVLSALPNASLDELRMTRSSADSTTLDAVIRFTLVYRR